MGHTVSQAAWFPNGVNSGQAAKAYVTAGESQAGLREDSPK